MAGVGMNWVGAGNAVPSRAQLDLIQTLKRKYGSTMLCFYERDGEDEEE